ncbi:hypothetical protein [Siminovitchia terrae]|uniref:hypothetical protein n=1 Tax=Siminovitchia terrae TaxID=1914933 RepID=UPI0028B224B1|nr:hypothetical protein [Siminovitchia terrae]
MTFTWLKKEYLITIIDAERILLNLFEARVLETKMNKPGLKGHIYGKKVKMISWRSPSHFADRMCFLDDDRAGCVVQSIH